MQHIPKQPFIIDNQRIAHLLLHGRLAHLPLHHSHNVLPPHAFVSLH